jgi:hypothetical protein
MVVVPASTMAKTTLRLPDLRARNGLMRFAECSEFCFPFHTLRRRDHMLASWLVVEAAVEDIGGTVANKLSSSPRVGSEVVRALPEVIR